MYIYVCNQWFDFTLKDVLLHFLLRQTDANKIGGQFIKISGIKWCDLERFTSWGEVPEESTEY